MVRTTKQSIPGSSRGIFLYTTPIRLVRFPINLSNVSFPGWVKKRREREHDHQFETKSRMFETVSVLPPPPLIRFFDVVFNGALCVALIVLYSFSVIERGERGERGVSCTQSTLRHH
jgi:hypothetical protein